MAMTKKSPFSHLKNRQDTLYILSMMPTGALLCIPQTTYL
jgi:hypothetical protein